MRLQEVFLPLGGSVPIYYLSIEEAPRVDHPAAKWGEANSPRLAMEIFFSILLPFLNPPTLFNRELTKKRARKVWEERGKGELPS